MQRIPVRLTRIPLSLLFRNQAQNLQLRHKIIFKTTFYLNFFSSIHAFNELLCRTQCCHCCTRKIFFFINPQKVSRVHAFVCKYLEFQRVGRIRGLGGRMFEISSKVQQIWYNCSFRFLNIEKKFLQRFSLKGLIFETLQHWKNAILWFFQKILNFCLECWYIFCTVVHWGPVFRMNIHRIGIQQKSQSRARKALNPDPDPSYFFTVSEKKLKLCYY